MTSAPPPGCPHHQPLCGPDFAADPAAVYATLRAHGSTAPVELAPGVRATLVTGYEAALHVLRSPETCSKDPRRRRDLADGTVAPDSPVVPMMMYRPNALFTDGEEHRRLRGAITDGLARIEPNTLRGCVERSADTLTDLIANSLRLLLSDDRFAGSLGGGSLPVEDALDEVRWTDPPMANYAVHYPVRDVVYEGAPATRSC